MGPHSIWVPSFFARLNTKLMPLWPPPPAMFLILMVGLPGTWSANVLAKRWACRLKPPPAPAGTISSIVFPAKFWAPAGAPAATSAAAAKPARIGDDLVIMVAFPVLQPRCGRPGRNTRRAGPSTQTP